MKLQHLTVIFIIIIIPILLVVSYYIGLQIDTINKQTAYDTKLQEATGEAISALEINTVEWNPKFSELQDSKRRDVTASINTFVKSISNKMGVAGTANEYTLNYIPAVVYTLYDGYYMYSNSDVPDVNIDDNGQIGLAENGEPQYNGNTEYKHVLQSFTPYSETLTKVNDDDEIITLNYTLDNFVRVYGKLDENGDRKKETIDYEGYLTQNGKITIDVVSNKINKVTYYEKELTQGESLSEQIVYKIINRIGRRRNKRTVCSIMYMIVTI